LYVNVWKQGLLFGNKEKEDFYSKQIGENEINKLSIWNTSQCQVDFQERPSLKKADPLNLFWHCRESNEVSHHQNFNFTFF
jgi:hypothetical protein